MCPTSEGLVEHLEPRQQADLPPSDSRSPAPPGDFRQLLADAVAKLENNTPEARRAIYAVARQVLAEGLQAASVGRAKPDVSREGVALEEAILRLELELGGVRAPDGVPPSRSPAREPPSPPLEPPESVPGAEAEQLSPGLRPEAPELSSDAPVTHTEAPIIPAEPIDEPVPPRRQRQPRQAEAPQASSSPPPAASPQSRARSDNMDQTPAVAAARPNRRFGRVLAIRLSAAVAVISAAMALLVWGQTGKLGALKSPSGEMALSERSATQTPTTPPNSESATGQPVSPSPNAPAAPLAVQGAEGLSASGEASLQSKDFDRAIGDLTAAIRENPKLVRAYVKRGEAWTAKGAAGRAARGDAVAKGYFERAIADFNTAIQLDPKLAVAFYDRGDAWVKLGNSDRAIDDFNEAIRFDPTNAIAYKYRGATFAYKGDNDRAITDFTRAIQFAGHDGGRMPAGQLFLAYNSRSILYEVKGLHERALSDLSQMIEIHKKDPQAIENFKSEWGAAAATAILASVYQRRAKIYEKKGLRADAVTDLTQAIQLDPDRAFTAYIERATIEEALAQREQAIADFRKALAINPNVKEAKEGLARLKASP